MRPGERLRSSRPGNQLPQPKDEATHRIHSLFRLRMHPSERLQSEARVPPVAGRTQCEASRASRPKNQHPQPKDEATHRIHSLFRLRMRWLWVLALVACDDGTTELTPADASSQTDSDFPDHGLDTFDPRCRDEAWVPAPCAAGEGTRHEATSAQHQPLDQPIVYVLSPPSGGDHRGDWARWGEYTSLPPQRWLHNLEHGGAALLYHPCAPASEVEALRTLITERPADFRWILTPYADLPATVAVVTWEWSYLASCVRPAEITSFIDQHYRQAPEDIAADGRYDVSWLGR